MRYGPFWRTLMVVMIPPLCLRLLGGNSTNTGAAAVLQYAFHCVSLIADQCDQSVFAADMRRTNGDHRRTTTLQQGIDGGEPQAIAPPDQKILRLRSAAKDVIDNSRETLGLSVRPGIAQRLCEIPG